MVGSWLRPRWRRFLLGGGLAAAVNLGLIGLLIEAWGFDTPLRRHLANAIAVELSLLLSFFIYRLWVWPGGRWRWREVLLQQIPLYQVAASAAVLLRVLVLFPVLDAWGVHYGLNTLVGVLVSATLNYWIGDRLLLQPLSGSSTGDLYVPEGLGPSLAMTPPPGPATPWQRVQLFSIVIPAYNEEGSIAATITTLEERLHRAGFEYEILVVNDNSRDRTEAVLQALTAQYPRLRYVNNHYPNGFGFAVRCGLEQFRGDAVAIYMADSSDDPNNLVDYYQQLQAGYECVFGSRFVPGGRVIDYPTHKLVINRLANLFVQILFGLPYNDTTNAFKAYRREVIAGIRPLLSHHFNLTVEMPLKAIARGYSYTVVPITWRNRKAGISKLKIREMGSRYLFIVLYVFLEQHLARGDYRRPSAPPPLSRPTLR